MATFDDLMAALRKGKRNAIQAADLARVLGFSPEPNQEDLRDFIRDAINNGALIGSSKKGYWEIDSLDELNTVVDSLESRAQGCATEEMHFWTHGMEGIPIISPIGKRKTSIERLKVYGRH